MEEIIERLEYPKENLAVLYFENIKIIRFLNDWSFRGDILNRSLKVVMQEVFLKMLTII